MRTYKYKDRPAVCVESKALTAVFLPQDGGKMASLRVKSSGKELLCVKAGENYKVLSYDGDYVSAECSAFDDMVPTVDPYTPEDGAYKGITYPDHGEICRIGYDALPFRDGVMLHGNSRIVPVEYEKTILAAEDGGLDIEYCISNHGTVPFPFLWAGHIMLQGEDGVRVFTPFGEETPTEMMFATEGVSQEELPRDRLTGYRSGEGAAYKFYYLEPMREGKFGLHYPDGSRLTFQVDSRKIPYLGIWFNNGEFQDLYSITPEPCTVPFDAPDRAAKRGYESVIPAGDRFTFTIHIIWEEKAE